MHLPHARVANIARAIERLQGAGFWVVGLDERSRRFHLRRAVPVGPGRRSDRQRRRGHGETHAGAVRPVGLTADARSGRIVERRRVARGGAVRVRAADPRMRLTSAGVHADTSVMGQQMPPPPGRPGSLESWERVIAEPPAAQHRRPAVVTVAGTLLMVAGGFAALAGLLILGTGDGATIEGLGDGAGTSTLAVIVSLALACRGDRRLVCSFCAAHRQAARSASSWRRSASLGRHRCRSGRLRAW